MDSVSVTWYGQSGFRLAAGDSRVLIDPFLSDRADRRYPPPASAADFADVTLVLCTHEHVDHLDLPFLREFCAVNSAAQIVVPAPVVEVAGQGRRRPDPPGRRGARGRTLRDADVTVHPVPALHGMGGDQPVVYEFAPEAARSGSSATWRRSAGSASTTPATAWCIPSCPPPWPRWPPTC